MTFYNSLSKLDKYNRLMTKRESDLEKGDMAMERLGD